MRPTKPILLLSAACALAFSTLVPAQGTGPSSTSQNERARCESGQSGQDRQTCLREVGAANQERPRGNLTDAPEANKFARCDYHKDPNDREYCIRRMKGEGTVTGSVEGGGVMRELRVITRPGL